MILSKTKEIERVRKRERERESIIDEAIRSILREQMNRAECVLIKSSD